MAGVDLRDAVNRFVQGLDRRVETVVTNLAVAYVGEVQKLMETSPRGGRTYRKIRARGTKLRARGLMPSAQDYIYHTASAPGEPPAPDRGILVNSIHYELGVGAQGFEARVGSSLAKIPLALEWGTRNGRIKPRPAFRPALEILRLKAPAIIARALPPQGAGQ